MLFNFRKHDQSKYAQRVCRKPIHECMHVYQQWENTDAASKAVAALYDYLSVKSMEIIHQSERHTVYPMNASVRIHVRILSTAKQKH